MDATRPKLFFFLVLIVMGLAGCTTDTDIFPPSGPVETEACFDPAPPTAWDSGGSCGWFIDLQLEGTRRFSDYTYNRCFTIPAIFSPGEELLVEVTGDWAWAGVKCAYFKREDPTLLPLYQYYGTFLVTE